MLICALESRASFEGEEQQDEAEKGRMPRRFDISRLHPASAYSRSVQPAARSGETVINRTVYLAVATFGTEYWHERSRVGT